ncbi:MAG: dihydroneopterin aldolase [Actinomycetota bacterium]|nr:dihydroneopterin aldolase [Actinomycetota bacterium]
MDRVELRGLRGRGRHGVLAHETALGQDFVVDLTLHFDTRAAARSDDLGETVDYGAVATAVVGVITGEPVALIETLAQRIADAALRHQRVQAVDVSVHKPEAPITVPFDDVVVTIHRERE